MNAEEGVQAEIAGLADRIEELQLQIVQAKQDGNDGEALSLREEKIALIQERTALINLKAAPLAGLRATQYVHAIQFKGKVDFTSATTVSELKSFTSELNVLFDTGAFDDFVERSVAHRMFDILTGAGNPVNLAGMMCSCDEVAHALAVIKNHQLSLEMNVGDLHRMVVQGVPIDVVIGLPTMCKWGIVFDTTNGHISLKVVRPLILLP